MALVKFNAAITSMQGKSGNANYAKTPYGIEFKNNPTRTKPQSPAQIAQQARVTKAGAAFRALNPTQNGAWQNYAKTYFVKSKTGELVHPSAYGAFFRLVTKLLQVNPAATLTTPPTGPFAGDSITIGATATSGKITFTANAKNSEGVTTEFLIQPLANPFRKPQATAYSSRGFYTFVDSGLSRALELSKGPYAVGYRFVNTQTGQETSRVLLGTVVVS